MQLDDEPSAGAPDWIVTFADMMSLLLTFFILLVSMSELRSESRVVRAVDALQRQFGPDKENLPGAQQIRGARVSSQRGNNPLVAGVRTGRQAMVGGSVLFEEGSAELDDDQLAALDAILGQFQGKLQKIEVRGHTSRRPPDAAAFADVWDLAYARCRRVQGLLEARGIEPGRIRIGVAGGNEPAYIGDDAFRRRENSRVEVFLLNEFNDDYEQAALESNAQEADSSGTGGPGPQP